MPGGKLGRTALTLAIGAGCALGALRAMADPGTPVVPSADLSTTTTSAPPASTTTTTRPPTTTTTAAPATSTTAPATTTTTTTAYQVPASWYAAQASIHRTPPSTDQALLAALAPLEKLGLSAEQAAIVGMGQFPVAGPASYSDDFMVIRGWPTPHLHMGIDIDAPSGTPLRAPVAGVLTYDTTDPDGYGIAAIVTQPDGTYYLMAHMSATVKGLADGSHVEQGQVVGFVGQTGDATGPHCHFEVHPHGGAAVDGKPILDAWQAQAIAAAPALIAAYRAAKDPAPPTTIEQVPFRVAEQHLEEARAGPPVHRLAVVLRPSTPIAAATTAALLVMILAFAALATTWPAGGGIRSGLQAVAGISWRRPRRRRGARGALSGPRRLRGRGWRSRPGRWTRRRRRAPRSPSRGAPSVSG